MVLGASGSLIRFAADDGAVEESAVAELVGSGRMRLQPRGPAGHPPARTGLAGLPPEAVEQARWWEAHIIEVVDGTPPDAPAGTPPRPAYDVERTSLAEREQAKAAELSAPGRKVAASTVKHRRQRWQAEGLPGLVDKRVQRRRSPAGRADPAVAAAMEQAIAEATEDSSRTASFIVWRTREILAGQGQEAAEPSRATMFRLFSRLSAGKHTTGLAATRRGLAGRPQRMFAQAHPAAPGELMEIDSTPLDVLVLLDDGMRRRDRHVGEHGAGGLHNMQLATRSGAEVSDTLKYLSERIPATFVYAGIDLERQGLFTGIRGSQIAGRFTLIPTLPFPPADEWRGLAATLEDALRLRCHQVGTLAGLDRYLHQRTGGMIGSLSHLIRGAAIEAIQSGSEQITRKLLDTIGIDHAAQQESVPGTAAARRTAGRR